MIHAYDQKAFAERLTGDRPIRPSIEAMRWARQGCSQLLDRMTEDDWRIVGTHTLSGRYGTEDWLKIYSGHAHDHAEQIKRARGKALGVGVQAAASPHDQGRMRAARSCWRAHDGCHRRSPLFYAFRTRGAPRNAWR